MEDLETLKWSFRDEEARVSLPVAKRLFTRFLHQSLEVGALAQREYQTYLMLGPIELYLATCPKDDPVEHMDDTIVINCGATSFENVVGPSSKSRYHSKDMKRLAT